LGRHQFNCDSADIVVIVNVLRDDLRDEFAMTDEAFALSPISARAAQPSEADYDAIREAFMETSRGRWFLGEYAKRNRNADTAMVLEAVARIEETLAGQKTPERDPALDEALGAIRAALEAAKIAASAALGDLALGENLAPVRKGARVIREISWRLREIGADGRICDLIDSQVGAIEEASGKLGAIDPAIALSAAFELIECRISAFDPGQASSTTAEPVEEALEPSPHIAEEIYSSPEQDEVTEEPEVAALPAASAGEQDAAEAITEAVQAAPVHGKAEAATDDLMTGTGHLMIGDPTTCDPMTGDPATGEPATGGPATQEPGGAIEAGAASDETTATIAEGADAYEAQDEAVLDMIAAEMAAPDSDQAYVPPGMKLDESEAAELPDAGSVATAQPAAPAPVQVSTPVQVSAPVQAATSLQASVEVAPEASLETSVEPPVEASGRPFTESRLETSSQPAPQPSPQASPQPSSQPSPQPSSQLSLGSSLIANGIVQRPRMIRPDPLAPIRRMSQSERIAFFS
jgi:hypothetical protein